MVLTAEQSAELDKQGFVVVKDFFDRHVMTKVSIPSQKLGGSLISGTAQVAGFSLH